MEKELMFTITIDWKQNHNKIKDCATEEDIALSIIKQLENLKTTYSEIKNIDVVALGSIIILHT